LRQVHQFAVENKEQYIIVSEYGTTGIFVCCGKQNNKGIIASEPTILEYSG